MTAIKPEELVEAFRLWVGWEISPIPSRDHRRVVERFGEQLGGELVVTIDQLERDYYATDAYRTAANYREMLASAAADFRAKYPKMPDEVIETLNWCYSYDYK